MIGCKVYSQKLEEPWILRTVLERGVNLLDVGAYDGATFSNSLALIEFGWHGVLVEPSPIPFDALLKRHGRNKYLKCVHALVGVESNPLVPIWYSDDGLSTTEKANHEHWADYGGFKSLAYAPQVTIPEILHAFSLQPDFVNIDTEGTSAELFLNYPFGVSRPMCFCVETDGRREEIEAFADSKGYSAVYNSDENIILAGR